jgi:hypothetical protein
MGLKERAKKIVQKFFGEIENGHLFLSIFGFLKKVLRK